MAHSDSDDETKQRLAEGKAEEENIQKLVQAIPGRILRPGALSVALLLAVGGGVSVSGYAGAQAAIRAITDAGVKPVRDDLDAFRRGEAERWTAQQVINTRIEAKQDEDRAINARRFEITIQTVLTRQYQPGTAELAKPPSNDGG